MDYGQIHHALALSDLEEDERRDVFGKLLHLERGFIGEVNRQRQREARKK